MVEILGPSTSAIACGAVLCRGELIRSALWATYIPLTGLVGDWRRKGWLRNIFHGRERGHLSSSVFRANCGLRKAKCCRVAQVASFRWPGHFASIPVPMSTQPYVSVETGGLIVGMDVLCLSRERWELGQELVKPKSRQ